MLDDSIYYQDPGGQFYLKKMGDLLFVTFPSFEGKGGIVHGFSARRGGVSDPPYDSLNVGYNTDDDHDKTSENRRRVEEALGIAPVRRIRQVHGREILILGKGDSRERIPERDALITDKPGIGLATTHADCPAVFFFDPVKRVIALAHAGWRGTLAEIALFVFRKMAGQFGCKGADTLAGISAGICRKCFEVDPGVRDLFLETYPPWKDFIQTRANRAYIDLWGINREQLTRAGIPGENISTANLCTSCREDLFFSYRRDGGKTGRMMALIKLEGRRS